MIGAYCAYVCQANGWPYPAAVPLALAVCGVLGYAVERWLIRPLYRRPFDTLVVTWGFSLLLRKFAEAMFGLGYKSVNVPVRGTVDVLGTDYPRYRLRADRSRRRRPRRRSSSGTRGAVPARASRRWSATPTWRSAHGIPVRALRVGDLRRRHLPGRARRRADRAARSGPAVHGSRLRADVVLRPRRRRARQRRRAALRRRRYRRREQRHLGLSDSTDGYFAVLVLAILFLWLKPRGIVARS